MRRPAVVSQWGGKGILVVTVILVEAGGVTLLLVLVIFAVLWEERKYRKRMLYEDLNDFQDDGPE